MERDLNLMPQAQTPTEQRYCKNCKRETTQRLELYDPNNLDSDLIWTCNECNEGNDFFELECY